MATPEEQTTYRWPQAWLFAATWAVLILVSGLLAWWARRHNITHGLACESRGTWGCGLFPPAAFGLWAILIAVPFVVAAAVAWRLLRARAPRAGALLGVGAFVGWVVAAVAVLRAALIEL